MTIGILYSGIVSMKMEYIDDVSGVSNSIFELIQEQSYGNNNNSSGDSVKATITLFGNTYTCDFFIDNIEQNINYLFIVINPYTAKMDVNLYTTSDIRTYNKGIYNILKPVDLFQNLQECTHNITIPQDIDQWIRVSDIELSTSPHYNSRVYKAFVYSIPKDKTRAEMLLYEIVPSDYNNAILFEIFG